MHRADSTAQKHVRLPMKQRPGCMCPSWLSGSIHPCQEGGHLLTLPLWCCWAHGHLDTPARACVRTHARALSQCWPQTTAATGVMPVLPVCFSACCNCMQPASGHSKGHGPSGLSTASSWHHVEMDMQAKTYCSAALAYLGRQLRGAATHVVCAARPLGAQRRSS